MCNSLLMNNGLQLISLQDYTWPHIQCTQVIYGDEPEVVWWVLQTVQRRKTKVSWPIWLYSLLDRMFYITCTKILVLWLVDSCSLFQLFIESGDKTSYCTPFGRQECKNYFTIVLIVYFYIRVFSISNTIFGRLLQDEANKKD